MKQILTFILVLMGLTIQAQSLRDTIMQNMSKKIIMEVVEPIELEVSFASVVVMETESGIVRSNINLTRTGWGWEEDNDYKHYVAAGNTRAALFLALLESGASPSDYYYTSGVYTDELAGCIIKDSNWSRGGWGNLSLDRGMHRSDIVIIEACQSHFARSMGTLAYYLSKTGIDLGDKGLESTYEDFCHAYERTPWDPMGILGYRDKITPLQITMWMQGIANNGRMIMPRFNESDSTKTIYEQMAQGCNIDSLKKTMRDEVKYGLLKKAESEYVPVSGITNVSQENGLGDRCAMFSGFIPGYTITVNIVMSGPRTRRTPISIAKGVIDWIAQHRLHWGGESKSEKKERPLPRGVD